MQCEGVDMIGLKRRQRLIQRLLQMVDRKIVMLHAARVVRAAGHHDADLGDELQPRAQTRPQRERGAHQRIGGVTAVDIGQIQGVDAQAQRGFQQIGHGLRRQLRAPVAEAHRAEDRR